jgi:hypothetical protein
MPVSGSSTTNSSATVAADDIHLAQGRAAGFSQLPEHYVARLVAARIVDLPEKVYVQHEYREVAAVASGAQQLLLGKLHEVPPVVQLRQVVDARLLFKFLLEPLALGNVPRHPQQAQHLALLVVQRRGMGFQPAHSAFPAGDRELKNTRLPATNGFVQIAESLAIGGIDKFQ